MPSRLAFLACLVTLSFSSICGGFAEETGDWTSWRGADGAGRITVGKFPVQFSSDKYRWRTELPGKGCSTPIVLNQTIYLTAPANGQDALLAYDANGQQQWQAVFGAENPGKHRNGSGSNASPATDGKSLFVYFKSGTLAAVDLQGKTLWQQNIIEQFGPEEMFWDFGTSPVLTKQHVILARMHGGESWIAAFNKNDGKLAWKTDRTYQVPTEIDQCYTTPLVIDFGGQESILTWGAEHLTIHSARDGQLIWSCGNFNPDRNRLWPAIATPVISRGHAVIAFGRNDRGIPLMYGVRLDGLGDVTATNHAWQRTDVGTFVPTPAVVGDQVLVLGDQGEVEVLEPVTGQTAWKDQLPKHRNKFYASPLVAGNLLYAIREDGIVFVCDIAENKFQLLLQNDMGESIIGSPIPLGNGILLRGEKHLFYVSAE